MCSVLYLHFVFVYFYQRVAIKKAACKMLVKLTRGVNNLWVCADEKETKIYFFLVFTID